MGTVGDGHLAGSGASAAEHDRASGARDRGQSRRAKVEAARREHAA